jgi:citrate lyase subunit beta/citryl-CoA lyase
MTVLRRPLRSVLFLPASNARALAKARTLDCDAVVLDLEDAVGPEAKAQARADAVQAARQGGFGRRMLAVRVNGIDTPWGPDDLRAVSEAPFDAVLAPKVATGGDVARYDARLAGEAELWAMIETPRALLHLEGIAGSAGSTRLKLLALGVNDLGAALRQRPRPDRGPLQAAMTLTVAAARAHGLQAIDGVYNALEDDAGLEAEARQGRDFGFDGKSAIHPRQLEIINRAFAPSDEERAWAEAVVAGFAAPENTGKGVIAVQGQMVERLHLVEAERVLQLQSSSSDEA